MSWKCWVKWQRVWCVFIVTLVVRSYLVFRFCIKFFVVFIIFEFFLTWLIL
jgi:hypothetical protein